MKDKAFNGRDGPGKDRRTLTTEYKKEDRSYEEDGKGDPD